MTTFDATILAIDCWFYFSWIFCVIYFHENWDGLLGYKEEKGKKKGQ